MPEMARLHESIKERWEGVNKSYVHPVKGKINIMKMTDTYMQNYLQDCFNHNVLFME